MFCAILTPLTILHYKAMSEKDMLLASRQEEFKLTMKVLKAYPADKLSFKPHERSRSAGELAFNFAKEEIASEEMLTGKVDWMNLPKDVPPTLDAILKAYDDAFTKTSAAIAATSEEQLNQPFADWGPGKRIMDGLWGMSRDNIHHRGQLSVYVRMAGGKVPSIYGPSADDPGR